MSQQHPSQKGRVLFVDDDPMILKALARSLRNQFEVLTAANFDEAMSLLEEETGLVGVVSDYELGEGKNGFELLTEVKRLQPQCIRVLISGSVRTTDLVAWSTSKVIQHFVNKPFTRREILACFS